MLFLNEYKDFFNVVVFIANIETIDITSTNKKFLELSLAFKRVKGS